MEQEVKETTTAVSVLDDYSVIVVDQERLQAFFSDGKNLDEVYGHIEKMAKGLVADVTTKEGVSQIKSCARQIASAKTKIDNLGKQVVAELKELPKIIDANRRNFRERMEALQDEIRRPVTEIDTTEVCPVCHGTGKIASSVVIDEQIERKIADLAVAKGLKTVTLKVSPMLGAYLTRGYFDSYLKKWKRKYKIRIGLEEVTKFSVLQNEIYNEKGERLD